MLQEAASQVASINVRLLSKQPHSTHVHAHSDTETQRHIDTETQTHRETQDTETDKRTDKETERGRDRDGGRRTETTQRDRQRLRETETDRQTDTLIHSPQSSSNVGCFRSSCCSTRYSLSAYCFLFLSIGSTCPQFLDLTSWPALFPESCASSFFVADSRTLQSLRANRLSS